jgi:hypothetical protein
MQARGKGKNMKITDVAGLKAAIRSQSFEGDHAPIEAQTVSLVGVLEIIDSFAGEEPLTVGREGMTTEQIDQMWNDALIMLLNSTATKTQKDAVRARLDALRHEMKVQAKMIELMAQYEERCPNYLYDFPGKHCHCCDLAMQSDSNQVAECWIEMYRHDAEAELKGGK